VTVAIDFEYNALEPRRLREVELPLLHGGRHHVARLFSRRVHRRRGRLEKSYSQIIEEEARAQRRKTIQQASDEFLLEYKVKHESPTFAVYALGHVTDHLGKKLVVEITPAVVKGYQPTEKQNQLARLPRLSNRPQHVSRSTAGCSHELREILNRTT
jgi:hypothetical protein